MSGLALHPSTPPTVKVTIVQAAITTASFTAPSGALLLACYTGAWSSTNSDATFLDSGGLQWHEVTPAGGQYAGNNDTCVQMCWAVTTDRSARTVTFTSAAAGANKTLQVYVLTGADTTTPIGDTSTSAPASGTFNDTGCVSTAAGSWTFIVACEGNGTNTFAVTSPTTIIYNNNAAEAICHAYETNRATGSGQTQSFVTTAPSSPDNSSVCFIAEIMPATSITDIAYMGTNISAAGASASSCPVTYPTGIASGDALVLVVGTKPYGATINNPDSQVWTARGTTTNGTTGQALDTGSTKIATFTKVATGSESGDLTVSITNTPNSSWAALMWFAKDSTKTWDFATDTSTAAAANAPWTTTFAASQDMLAAGDVVALGSVCSTDLAITNSASALSATGTTWDAMADNSAPLPITGGGIVNGQIRITTGNDSGGNVNFGKVLTGPSTDDLTWSMNKSVSTNQGASTAVVRLRQVSSQQDATVSGRATVAGVGGVGAAVPKAVVPPSTAVAAVVAVPATTRHTGETVSAVKVTTTAAQPAVTLHTGETVSASVVAGVAAQPTAIKKVIRPAAVVAAVGGVGTATVQVESSPAATLVEAVGAVGAATVQAGTKVTTTTVGAVGGVGAAAAASRVSAGAVAAVAGVGAVTPRASWTVTPARVIATVEVGAAGVTRWVLAVTVPGIAEQPRAYLWPAHGLTVTGVGAVGAVRLGTVPAASTVATVAGVGAASVGTASVVPAATIAAPVTVSGAAEVAVAAQTVETAGDVGVAAALTQINVAIPTVCVALVAGIGAVTASAGTADVHFEALTVAALGGLEAVFAAIVVPPPTMAIRSLVCHGRTS